MNDFESMWKFPVKEGVDFVYCTHVHPLMQNRVQKILTELKKDRNVQKIVLFGSSLEFRCDSFSDLDLYLEKKDPGLSLENEPESDCVVDLVMDLDHASSLYQEIDRTGLLLFDRENENV